MHLTEHMMGFTCKSGSVTAAFLLARPAKRMISLGANIRKIIPHPAQPGVNEKNHRDGVAATEAKRPSEPFRALSGDYFEVKRRSLCLEDQYKSTDLKRSLQSLHVASCSSLGVFILILLVFMDN